MIRFLLPDDKPKSWVVFLDGLLLGLLVFVPLVVVALHYEMIPLFLFAALGLAIVWLTAAFLGQRFAASLAAGRYRDLQPLPWRDQVW